MTDREEPKIRPAGTGDLDALMFIEKQGFTTPWSAETFVTQISNPLAVFLVSEDDDILSGFSLSWVLNEKVHIMKLAVREDFRRRGIGRLLLEKTLETGRERGGKIAFLEVRPGNREAIYFYRDGGFLHAGIHKGYYQDTSEDAVIMFKELV